MSTQQRLTHALGVAVIIAVVGCGQAAKPPPSAPPVATTTVVSGVESRAGPAPTFVSIVGAPPGQTAHVTVQTQAGSTCSVVYFTPEGTLGVADGLNEQVADGSGQVTWSWAIEPKTATGKGNLRVRCNGVDATADIPIG